MAETAAPPPAFESGFLVQGSAGAMTRPRAAIGISCARELGGGGCCAPHGPESAHDLMPPGIEFSQG